MAPLSASALAQIAEQAAAIPVLLGGQDLSTEILALGEVRGPLRAKAPHYLVIYGSGDQWDRLNAGFVFEQWVLWMTAQGYATCWLGGVKPLHADGKPEPIVGIAFGHAATPGGHLRKDGQSKRRSLAEISRGDDPRFEAVRLAPSGVNGQPWYLAASEEGARRTVHVYMQTSGLLSLVYRLREVDMGIALAHLFVASGKHGLPFSFSAKSNERAGAPEAPKGYSWLGVVR